VAFGNVIPIDTDIARQLARRQVRFRWLVACLSALWVAIVVPTLVLTPLPPLAPFIALALLVILAEHRFVLFGDETSMSASIVVVVASIFVFTETSPLAGPILVASIGGIYIPHLRTRAFSKIAFNGAGMGIGAACAALVVGAFTIPGDSNSRTVCTAFAAVVIYWVVNNTIVAGHQVALCGAGFRSSARLLICAETDVLPWAAASCMGVIAAGGNLVAATAFIACMVTLRVVAVTRARSQRWIVAQRITNQSGLLFWLGSLPLMTHGGSVRVVSVAACASIALIMPTHGHHSHPLVAMGLPLVAVATVGSGLDIALLGLVATLILVACSQRLPNAWTYSVAAGTAILGVGSSALPGWFDHRLSGAALCVTVVSLSSFSLFAIKVLRTSRSIGPWTTLGLAVPGVAWVQTVLLGTGIALMAVNAPIVALGFATAVIAFRGAMPLSAPRSSAVASH